MEQLKKIKIYKEVEAIPIVSVVCVRVSDRQEITSYNEDDDYPYLAQHSNGKVHGKDSKIL